MDTKKVLLEPLGIKDEWNRPEIFLTEEEDSGGEKMCSGLAGGKKLVTVDPSHRRRTRRWPAAHFGALCALMAEKLEATPVVLWGPGEEALADEVVEASGGLAKKAPPTNLREMSALIKAAAFHLGNCSAPRHIAVSVGTPTFTILGSTSAGWTHPSPEHADVARGIDCQPCNSNVCDREHECLDGFPPGEVFKSLGAWLEKLFGWSI